MPSNLFQTSFEDAEDRGAFNRKARYYSDKKVSDDLGLKCIRKYV